MLGLGYLNLGEPSVAVKQYQRALALREAMQGVNAPETADCRNQLAITYRIADLPTEAAHLFERNPVSPSHAAALVVRGTVLLHEHKPTEAELKLREALAIRQKAQPDDRSTFETKSLLGEALVEEGKFAEAEPLLLSGYEGMKEREGTNPPQDKTSLIKALRRLVKLYEAWGKEDQAVKWRKVRESAELTKRT
jgi:tetratricopeptide (TPR) repeat protein